MSKAAVVTTDATDAPPRLENIANHPKPLLQLSLRDIITCNGKHDA